MKRIMWMAVMAAAVGCNQAQSQPAKELTRAPEHPAGNMLELHKESEAALREHRELMQQIQETQKLLHEAVERGTKATQGVERELIILNGEQEKLQEAVKTVSLQPYVRGGNFECDAFGGSWTGAVIYVEDPQATLKGTSDCKYCNKLVELLVGFGKSQGWRVGTGAADHFAVLKGDKPCPRVLYVSNGKVISQVNGYHAGMPLFVFFHQHPLVDRVHQEKFKRLADEAQGDLIQLAVYQQEIPKAPGYEGEEPPRARQIDPQPRSQNEGVTYGCSQPPVQSYGCGGYSQPVASTGSYYVPVQYYSTAPVYQQSYGSYGCGGGMQYAAPVYQQSYGCGGGGGGGYNYGYGYGYGQPVMNYRSHAPSFGMYPYASVGGYGSNCFMGMCW